MDILFQLAAFSACSCANASILGSLTLGRIRCRVMCALVVAVLRAASIVLLLTLLHTRRPIT